jgi:phenylalanine-4-hydroxylase
MMHGSAADSEQLVRPAEQNEIWSVLFERVYDAAKASEWHHPTYLKGLSRLADYSRRAPTLLEINRWLHSTGWSTDYVTGYVPVLEYRSMLAARTFPVARAIRSKRDLDHSAAPDFAHDVLGHLPMLFDPDYRELLHQWACVAVKALPSAADREVSAALDALIDARQSESLDEQRMDSCTQALLTAHRRAVQEQSRCFRLENFFTWSIEFGVLARASGVPRLLGAAALSSPGEMQRIFAGHTRLTEFGPAAVLRSVDYTRYQAEIYIAGSFDHYRAVLADI